MGTTYRVGIVGLSGITARRPVDAPPPFRNTMSMSHAGALAYMPNMEVAGYCDLVRDLIADFGRTWADVWPGATGYTDYRRMLAEERLDILAVATSDNRHADIAVAGAEAGVRGLFVEKPLATSLEDADRIIAACEANGAALTTDHTWRWDPLYHRVRDAVHAGDIGTLSTIVATLTGPRAMLFRNGTHTIDGICFFAESEPTRVFGRLEDGFDHWDRYRGDGGHLPENEPFANGYVEFANGVRAHYCSDKRGVSDSSYVLYGEKGRIVLTPWGGHQDRTAELLTTDASGETVRRTLVPGQYLVRNLMAAYEELVGLMENGGDGTSSGREARKTVQIMVGFLESHRQGSRLIEAPDQDRSPA